MARMESKYFCSVSTPASVCASVKKQTEFSEVSGQLNASLFCTFTLMNLAFIQSDFQKRITVTIKLHGLRKK